MKKGEAAQTAATLQVGKAGITDTFIAELKEQVKRRKVVKVRLLKTSRGEKSPKETSVEIAQRSGTRVLDVRGFTAVFAQARPIKPGA